MKNPRFQGFIGIRICLFVTKIEANRLNAEMKDKNKKLDLF
jgi:hypothetical protein